jgi:predicted HicB family RNase H-like nuclease
MMEYKGYMGNIEFDDQAGIFHGEVVNTRDVITFQGRSVSELRKAFRDSVDDYLEFCAERGEKPDKPYSGQFITRLDPDLHRNIAVAAAISGQSLNSWVSEQLDRAAKNALFKEKRSKSRRHTPQRATKTKTTRHRV